MTTTTKLTHLQKAVAWMKDNPEAMALFRRFAADRLRHRRAFSIAQITERVRWEFPVATTGEDGLKLNNNHKAYIARQLIAEMPDLKPLIVCRVTRGPLLRRRGRVRPNRRRPVRGPAQMKGPGYESCQDCYYRTSSNSGHGSGECHRFPPVAETNPDRAIHGGFCWPTLNQNPSWCGEFKSRKPNQS